MELAFRRFLRIKKRALLVETISVFLFVCDIVRVTKPSVRCP